MAEKSTELLIHDDNLVDIQGTHPPVKFAGKRMFLRRSGDAPISYYRLHDLSRINKLLITEINGNGELTKSKLPQDIVNRIAQFLKLEKDVMNSFDYHSFVHFAYNIPYARGQIDVSKWNFRQSKEEELCPGDAVFLSATNQLSGIVHSAIYLGSDRYLSKFGGQGKLVVTDQENMKKGWSGSVIFQAIPAQRRV